jgi:hypothetical protein
MNISMTIDQDSQQQKDRFEVHNYDDCIVMETFEYDADGGLQHDGFFAMTPDEARTLATALAMCADGLED